MITKCNVCTYRNLGKCTLVDKEVPFEAKCIIYTMTIDEIKNLKANTEQETKQLKRNIEKIKETLNTKTNAIDFINGIENKVADFPMDTGKRDIMYFNVGDDVRVTMNGNWIKAKVTGKNNDRILFKTDDGKEGRVHYKCPIIMKFKDFAFFGENPDFFNDWYDESLKSVPVTSREN
jgi:hypothetical protein